MAEAIAGNHHESLSDVAINLKVNRTLKLRRVSRVSLSDLAIEFWVAGFPDAIAEMNAPKVQRTAPKCENCVWPVMLDRVDPPAFF